MGAGAAAGAARGCCCDMSLALRLEARVLAPLEGGEGLQGAVRRHRFAIWGKCWRILCFLCFHWLKAGGKAFKFVGIKNNQAAAAVWGQGRCIFFSFRCPTNCIGCVLAMLLETKNQQHCKL